MKKIFSLAAALALLAGCDDGEMTFKTFDFTDVDPVRCDANSDVIFKINDNDTEVLILDIDAGAAFLNVETPDGSPRQITVDGTANRLIYRNYNGNVTAATLCSDIPPVSPSVLEEWQGDGVLEIITNKVFDEDDPTHVTGYIHQITLKSVTFTKENSDEQVVITDNNYGSIVVNLGFDFDFESTTEAPITLQPCNENPLGPFYSLSGTEALVLTLDSAIVNNTDLGEEIIELDDSEDNNELLLRVFSSSISESSICSLTPPVTPTELQRWSADEGQIKIVTTESNGAYIHTVHLIAPADAGGVVFVSINSDERYTVESADFVIGRFITEN